ncbi:cytochrome b [Catenovulum sp. SM1970]|nr:cytochrome b [Marinifaba aquimaris]NTS75779.1 cytochrome b [Marinifaba aquimaris]
MSLRNSRKTYGTIAKYLHWITALLFLGAYLSVYYRQWFTIKDTPENWNALQLHLSFGITIGVLVLLRVIWRLTERAPDLEPGSAITHFFAHIGHYVLYAVMIIMPITGYMATGASNDFFFLFSIAKFEDTWLYTDFFVNTLGITVSDYEQTFDYIHKDILGAWGVWLLILFHILAALYHHYIKQDDTLIKMTSRKANDHEYY